MFDEIVIGGGASGLFCASLLPKEHKKLILEKTSHLGTKVLLSGKGRCNFTNLRAKSQHYLGDQTERLDQLFETFWPQEMIAYLAENGIASKEEDNGRMLLQSNRATQLVDFLIAKNQEQGTELRTDAEVLKLEKKEDCFLVHTAENSYQSKRLILATGGCSFPKLGASDFAFQFAEEFQLPTHRPAPALCGIETRESLTSLSGSSVQTELQLFDAGKLLWSQQGNLLFTHWGISWPLVFNASLYLGYHYNNFKNLTLKLKIPASQITKRLLSYLKAPRGLKNYTLTLYPQQLRSRDEAKVMSGGICFATVDEHFEVRSIQGLYLLGEALNITGETGGFNLQRCRTSAFHCAKRIAGLN